MADTIFKATATSLEGLSVKCETRGFSFQLDEPESLGGTDTGMNPVEAVLSALGACKCIVARAFAQAKHINLQDVHIDLEGVLDPDGFVGKNKDAKIGFSKITTKFYFKADNTPEQLKKFAEFIEAHCPVHDTIANAPNFETEVHCE
jgi:uncharacterized OsmC-like protein